VLDALMLLMEKIQKGNREPITVPPRELPKLAQIRTRPEAVSAADAAHADELLRAAGRLGSGE
jgi:hypothetical protein